MSGPFLDGIGVQVLAGWTDDKINEVLGQGSNTIPYPELSVVYAPEGDHVTVTLETNYDLVTENEVVLGYTTDGTTPNETSTEFHSPMELYKNGVLTVRAFLALTADNLIKSVANSVNISGLKCQTPVINYDDSTYTITLSCATQGATIHYTIDGSSVSAASPVYNGAITIDESVTIQVLAVKDGIQNSNTVSKVCNVARILCTSFPIEGKDGTRLTPSTDPLHLVTETITSEPVPEIPGTQAGSSPYDQYGPWQKKRRNFVNGAPDAWDGDSGFSTTEKDTMAYYPDCYIKLAVSGSVEYFYISDKPYEGFEKAKWAEKYKAVYETSNNNESKSGKSVQVNQSITTMRTNANNKGTGWEILDAVMHSADQWLFMVEYASRDAQGKIGQGISNTSAKHTTGETDVLTYHTGRCSGTNGNTAVRYRWSENLWGNVYEWCDGVRSGSTSYTVYVTDNPELYAQSNVSGYIEVKSSTSQVSASQIGKFAHNSQADWCCFIPDTGSSSSTDCAAPDYGYTTSNSYYFLRVSGYWDNGSDCGLFFFLLGDSASGSNSSVGSRLTYREAS